MCALGLSLVAAAIPTQEAMFFILSIGLFNGVMWPIIFDLGLRGMGRKMPFASGLMITGIIGAAIAFAIAGSIYVPAEEGLKKHDASMNIIILIASVCYVYIIFYALRGYRYNMKEKILSNE
jgi:FHS family L-fucose permease-like MFS transporter